MYLALAQACYLAQVLHILGIDIQHLRPWLRFCEAQLLPGVEVILLSEVPSGALLYAETVENWTNPLLLLLLLPCKGCMEHAHGMLLLHEFWAQDDHHCEQNRYYCCEYLQQGQKSLLLKSCCTARWHSDLPPTATAFIASRIFL